MNTRVIFMGTPAYAARVLEGLGRAGYNVVACFAQPDKPAGRKLQLVEPAVKQSAKELGIPVYQPASIRGQDAEELIASLSPDLIISAAYGKILPKNILNIPNKGCLNVHGSLLPKYRGAAPVQWAIYNGDDKTGVTIMLMDDGIDTGDIISVAETPITLDMNAAILMDELSTLGTELLIKTLPEYLSGKIIATPQEHSEATYAPMITKEQGRIDWSRSAMEIHNQIRAFSIWPAAYTTYKGRTLKIHCSYVESDQSKILCDYRDTAADPKPGTIICAHKDVLAVACGQGVLCLSCIQPESCRRMFSEECAHNYTVSEVFGEE